MILNEFVKESEKNDSLYNLIEEWLERTPFLQSNEFDFWTSYQNAVNKKKQIDLLISEIHGFITTIDDVVLVAPLIKEYMEVSVKNDDHLVKLAGVLQRIITRSTGDSDESMLLSEQEKEDLLNALQDTTSDLQIESDRIEKIKNNSKINIEET